MPLRSLFRSSELLTLMFRTMQVDDVGMSCMNFTSQRQGGGLQPSWGSLQVDDDIDGLWGRKVGRQRRVIIVKQRCGDRLLQGWTRRQSLTQEST